MTTEVTCGVKVSVITQFEEDLSNPANRHFIFSYRIIIENQNPFEIQLLRRHWYIRDSMSVLREVEGEGVVGQQPIIYSGEIYEYESACNLVSDFGMMHGEYLFRKAKTDELLRVSIPEFKLEILGKLN